MKKLHFALNILLYIQAISSPAQVTGSSGTLLGPGPTALPNFTATLNGANANPPNNNPFTATATITLQASSDDCFEPATNLFYCLVRFPIVLFSDTIMPSVVSIQRQGGQILRNAHGPLILAPDYHRLPDEPCFFSDCSNSNTFPFRMHYQGGFILSDKQIIDLLAGHWYVDATLVTVEGHVLPDSELRGQIRPIDSDQDGVPDYLDECPNTPAGEVVDAEGCSIEQLCPCEASWKNHIAYVKCVKMVTAHFKRAGLITEVQERTLFKEAKSSGCGSKKGPGGAEDNDDNDNDNDGQ